MQRFSEEECTGTRVQCVVLYGAHKAEVRIAIYQLTGLALAYTPHRELRRQ
jgi:hypothetical protein